jgi:3-hydroxybenzoate/4-hydroxybenzoate---CoA ligase
MNAAEHVLMGGLRVAGIEKPAVVCSQESLTYGALTVRVSQFTAALRGAGLCPGDRVAMLMLDTPDLVVLHLAVMAAGGVAVAVSTRSTPAELRDIFTVMSPFAVVIDDEFTELVAGSLAAGAPASRLLLRERDLAAWKTRPDRALVPYSRKPADAAYWVMTSGTTGQPKAVEHRHDNVLCCTDYLDHGLAATAADRFFATSRLHFAYALGTTLFGALRIGATTILHERWPTPSTVAATMDLYKPTVVFSVPTLYHKLLETGLSQKAVFRTVRRYVSAGERLSPKIGAAWETATGRPVLDAMSCSELVHKIFTNTPTSHRAGSSGRPMPGVQVRLIDHDGAEVTNAGQTGRLEVHAPFLCAGYRTVDAPPGNPAHRPCDRFKNGWFATGDQYLRDEDGFFYHCGRSDDMLKIAGLWVSPSEIEDALAGIPSIAEAAAISAETLAGLLEIVLYIAPVSGADDEATLAEARERLSRSLPRSKLPRRYVIVSELPRTATGKIQRHKLRIGMS